MTQIADGRLEVQDGRRGPSGPSIPYLGVPSTTAGDGYDISFGQCPSCGIAGLRSSRFRCHITTDISTKENGRSLCCPFRHIDIHILVGGVLHIRHEIQLFVGGIIHGFPCRKFDASSLPGRSVKDESIGWNGGAAGSGK